MYFVGKKQIKVRGEWRYPGSPLPEAETFASLRDLLRKGHIACDGKDGEVPWTEMSPVKCSTIASKEAMIQKIKEETGVDVPSGTKDREIRPVYRALMCGDPLPEADFLTPVEVKKDSQDDLVDALFAIDGKTHLATIKATLKKAGVDAKDLAKEAALAKVAELIAGA